MNPSRTILMACGFAGLAATAGFGAEIALVPVSATGNYSFSGDEIILEGGGQRVTLELELSGWSPARLKSWQAVIDSAGYSSGLTGTLTPAVVACTYPNNTPCVTAFGPGATCDVPPFAGLRCTPGFIDVSRSDYVYAGVADMPAVDLSVLDFRYASMAVATPPLDPGSPRYAGTLVLDVPPGTVGSFTIPLVAADGSLMQDEYGALILPLTLTPALITVHCQTNEDCDDGNGCTNDVCELSGSCSHAPNYDPADDCCDPADGTLTPIDDDNDCTTDTCDPVDGSVTHDPLDDGTPCTGGVYCLVDRTCLDGACTGDTPRDCQDGIDCTDDWCDEAQDRCVHDPDHDDCPDDGLFCNGDEFCNTSVGCDHSGSPCAGPCDEENDRCPCEPPAAVAFAQRYLKITPGPPDVGMVGIAVTPDCPGAAQWYVGPPTTTVVDAHSINVATLVPPGQGAWRAPAGWGEVYVYSRWIVPGTTYLVQQDCGSPGSPALSGAATATTPIWGDAIGEFEFPDIWTPPDGHANIIDVLAGLETFRHSPYAASTILVDLVGVGQSGLGCIVDRRIDIIDVVAALDAFKGFRYAQSTGCPVPCP